MLYFFFPLDKIGSLRMSFGWDNSWIDWLSYISAVFQVTPFLIQSPINRTILTTMGTFAILFIVVYIFLALIVHWMVSEKIKNNFLVDILRF